MGPQDSRRVKSPRKCNRGWTGWAFRLISIKYRNLLRALRRPPYLTLSNSNHHQSLHFFFDSGDHAGSHQMCLVSARALQGCFERGTRPSVT